MRSKIAANLRFSAALKTLNTRYHLRWLPRVIVKHPPHRARVRKRNVVNSSLSFPRSDLPEWVLLK